MSKKRNVHVVYEDDNVYHQEYRMDPWDGLLYTKSDFIAYYGRELEWKMQDPKKILHRMKINDMIFKYKNVLHEDNIEYLLEKMIHTFE
tara:strand:+ start:604 stop:870 length:267 start_codon:yes stop_codon:yes gene_type:complete